jgi:hypothetical protein
MKTMDEQPTDLPETTSTQLPLELAIELQDDLIVACGDLDRLSGLLRQAYDELGQGFHEVMADLARDRDDPAATRALLARVEERLARAVTALQFDDLSTQLITHTRARLRHAADSLASSLLGDEDGDGFVQPPPRRPNPVTQDEMDAGSVELF